jgi:hypothetical protein
MQLRKVKKRKGIWKNSLASHLKPTRNLIAYRGVPIRTLGDALVKVHAYNKTLTLPVSVVEGYDEPLAIRSKLKFKFLPRGRERNFVCIHA